MKEISLEDGFGEVAVKVNGVVVQVPEDGSVDTYTEAPVRMHHANDSATSVAVNPGELKPGECMADGTVYAGISPDTHKPMYTAARDALLTYTFGGAQEDCTRLPT